MQFIVIEGLDGSGKSTQIRYVKEYLEKRDLKTKFIHFPRTDSPIWGELISRFLRGELGDINNVDPYIVAMLYAGDRKDAAALLEDWMEQNYMVIADRYLYSNIAFQCAKIEDQTERDKLAKWIKHLEYTYNKIPVPDLNIFLNVPFEFTRSNLINARNGNDRDYLNGADDIHESDLVLQQKVREIYIWQVRGNEDFEMIDCSDNNGNMLTSEIISKLLIGKIEQKISLNK
ncbi:MAG: dTMP kinase [Bacteroidales bacterium]|nr:dTMP kinase [Bacteroidales bacterium]